MGVQRSALWNLMLITGVVLLLGSVITLFWLQRRLEEMRNQSVAPTPPVLAELPPFLLADTSGRTIGLENFRGSVWIADFIFTRCLGPCPLMTSRMAKLQETFQQEPSLKIVSITVDPEFDTSPVLKSYGERFKAQEGRWFFLTGEKARIHELAMSGFLVGGVQDVTLHSTRFILVDQEGKIRGYYDSQDDQEIQKLIHDARTLLGSGKS